MLYNPPQSWGMRVGGYLVVRRSRWGWWPHFLHGRRGRDGKLRVVGYAPIKPRRKAVPPPLFRGTVHWGDNAEFSGARAAG